MSTSPSSSLLAISAEHERLARDPWQRPAEVIAHLALTGDEAIVDLGAGTGYFTWHLAAAVPGGRVQAIEPDATLRAALTAEAERRSARQVAVAAAPSGTIDLLFACDMLRVLDLEAVAAFAARRVAVIDFHPEAPASADSPPRRARVDPAKVILHGYRLVSRLDLPRQYLLVFERA
jgi:predicted methyltransferase